MKFIFKSLSFHERIFFHTKKMRTTIILIYLYCTIKLVKIEWSFCKDNFVTPFPFMSSKFYVSFSNSPKSNIK